MNILCNQSLLALLYHWRQKQFYSIDIPYCIVGNSNDRQLMTIKTLVAKSIVSVLRDPLMIYSINLYDKMMVWKIKVRKVYFARKDKRSLMDKLNLFIHKILRKHLLVAVSLISEAQHRRFYPVATAFGYCPQFIQVGKVFQISQVVMFCKFCVLLLLGLIAILCKFLPFISHNTYYGGGFIPMTI